MVTYFVLGAALAGVGLLTLLWTALSWGLVLTILGLSWDALGAITLAFGLLRRDMAVFRGQKPLLRQERALPRHPIRRIPLELAFCLGSKDVRDTSPGLIDEFSERFWGLVLLALGFLLQAAGQWAMVHGGGPR